MKFQFAIFTIATFLLIGSFSFALANEKIDFDTDVAPILNKHCAACHNDEESESDFDVSNVAQILNGSSAGAAIFAGEGSASHIIKLMKGTEEPAMPPIEEFDRVPDDEIAIVERWIDAGAKPSPEPSRKSEHSAEPATLSIDSPELSVNVPLQPAILSADWSPDGSMIAIAKFGSVELLDADSEKLIHSFSGLPGKVNSVQFSTDGKQLVAASGVSGVGGQAFLWNVDSKKILQQFDGHSDVMYDAVLSDDGKLIATSAYDKTILLWDAETGEQIRTFKGHNAAVYDLDFSPDSQNLVSASGDQTLKVWRVATGQRLDTLGQPLKEQFVAAFSPDGVQIVGGGRDNRIRVWNLKSIDSPAVNPIAFAGFAHEASIVRIEYSEDGSKLFTSAEDRKVKIWDAETFAQIGVLETQPEVCSALAVAPDGKRIFLGRLDGSMQIFDVPRRKTDGQSITSVATKEAWQQNAPVAAITTEVEPNSTIESPQRIRVPARIAGVIDSPSDAANDSANEGSDIDLFEFEAVAGEALMIETRAAQDKSPLDSKIEILHVDGSPVPQVVLRAVRDSYFTFRGKDSDTFDDYRVHNWQEMELNEYLYANGEVVKLFLHPRGPDSGFRVFPGSGKRFNYFGTTPMSHALQEPCYIVEPHPPGTTFVPNGLPTFELNYENDDDSRREIGSDSRLKFVPPKTGRYLVRVTDVRGFGGDDFKYTLSVRQSNPGFSVEVKTEKKIKANSGQYFQVVAKRRDDFEGPLRIDIENVPPGYRVSTPLFIEAGQIEALGTVFADADASSITKEQADAIVIRTRATIAGQEVVEVSKGFGEIELEDGKPKIEIQIVRGESDALSAESNFDQPIVLEIRPGESIEAHVVAVRNDHNGRISFGTEGAGRNLPHGVTVDDIGLNGLMITAGNLRQRFFIKAEPFVKPQVRSFFLRANDVDGIVSPPVLLKILPAKEEKPRTDRNALPD